MYPILDTLPSVKEMNYAGNHQMLPDFRLRLYHLFYSTTVLYRQHGGTPPAAMARFMVLNLPLSMIAPHLQ